jgi:hypothetical protein
MMDRLEFDSCSHLYVALDEEEEGLKSDNGRWARKAHKKRNKWMVCWKA